MTDQLSQRFDVRDKFRLQALEAAARAIRAGQCIVLPTDTVYGIGADAYNAHAVQSLLNAKERGRDMPPPVLIAEAEMLAALVADLPQAVEDLCQECWPGALTLIMKAQADLGMGLGRTAGTIAVRVPDEESTRELLRWTGPLAVSSANISGRPAAMSIDEAYEMLGNKVAVYLDSGPSRLGVASTIVDIASDPRGRIVRQGACELETIRRFLPHCAAKVDS